MRTWQTLVYFFQLCKDGKSLTQLHSIIIKSGLIYDVLWAAKLNNLYSIYAPLDTVRKLFDETPRRSAYTWNSILKCYCVGKQYQETLSLFSNMLSSQKPDYFSVGLVLKACSALRALEFGKMIHGFVKKNEHIDSNLFVGSRLIDFYSKCGKVDDALGVFEEYDVSDVVLWTSMVTGYEQNSKPEKALDFFSKMVMVGGLTPDSIMLVSVVSACAQILDLNAGRSVHGFMIRRKLDGGLSLLNALLNLYSKWGSVKSAVNIFSKMEEKDVISWGSMISCFAHNGSASHALELLNEMTVKGVEPNSVIVISALQACEATGNLELGKKLHKLAVQKGFELDVMVATALVDMYMNCSSSDEAVELFGRMVEKDAVSWSAVLCGCVQNGLAYKSMGLFRDMLCSQIQPDAVVMVKVLTACSELGILQQACCFHGYLIRGGFDSNAFIRASLIESYAKCGSLGDAIKVFEVIKYRDIVIWSSMFAGYGFHGRGKESLELFHQMVTSSTISPNNVTFLSVLSACSHAGLVEEAIKLFTMMVNDYQLTPESKHYGIMVDLLGRTGELNHAMDIINQMPLPICPHVWGALLGASLIHQNMEMAEVAARNVFQLDPNHAGYYVLLSNMYARDGKWDNAAKLRTFVKEKELKKVSGQSIIELRDEVHTFIANDRYHPNSEQIYDLLIVLHAKMREEDYILDLDFLPHDTSDGV